jgi:SecD/SecF fusion protein
MPFSMEINQAFIAAILTVIGYSLNDTVVVFDRIREFVNEHTSWPLGKTVNVALDSTISRTLNTSLTTLIVLLAIFIFGGESIRGFMFALIIGVIVGTYSSLFIATPVMFDSVTDKSKIEKKKKIEEDSEATTA